MVKRFTASAAAQKPKLVLKYIEPGEFAKNAIVLNSFSQLSMRSALLVLRLAPAVPVFTAVKAAIVAAKNFLTHEPTQVCETKLDFSILHFLAGCRCKWNCLRETCDGRCQ